MASASSVFPAAPYLCYPGLERFGAFGYGDYLRAVAAVRARGGLRNRVLHLQIPFYGAGSQPEGLAAKDRSRGGVALYLNYLKQEIEIQGCLFADMNELDEVHLTGGIATCFSERQTLELLARVRRYFALAPDESGEYSLRADPHSLTAGRLDSLRGQGFNRLVLAATMDGQTDTLTRANALGLAVSAARDAGFHSVSVELLLGATQHHAFAVNAALARVIAAQPDRISIFDASAALPQCAKLVQSPDRQTALDLLRLSVKRLGEAGYLYLGTDQFVRPDDELAVAQAQGRLHRRLQNYSIHPEADVIACGLGAIGAVGATISQNHLTLADYYAALDIGELPIARGVQLSMDDALRRRVIDMLMCHFELAISSLELGYPITFATYFAGEIEQLRRMEAEGLLTIGNEWLTVTPRGRLQVRDICHVFERPSPARAAVMPGADSARSEVG